MPNLVTLAPGENVLAGTLQQLHAGLAQSDQQLMRLRGTLGLPPGNRILPGQGEVVASLAIDMHPQDAMKIAVEILDLGRQMGWRPPG
jgi:hypothetical protein